MKDRIYRDANAGDPYACLGVAYYYHTGKEQEQDYATAIKWYERAAEGKCPRAHWELAKIYRDGEVVPRDLSHYVEHLRASAELGNSEAQLALGTECLEGFIVKQDEAEAFAWFRKAAESGESMAKFRVGYCYSRGIGVPRSRTEAEMWYSSTGLTGDAELFMELGMNFEYGSNGIIHNEVEAGRWYKFGADMGHEKCMICWRSLMAGLNGETKDTLEVRMHKLSTCNTQKETNIRDSALEMADECLDMGDEAKAFSYYERAAGLGSPVAMFTIGMMYHLGIYVKRNDKKAFEILIRAASAGSEDAQFYLGRMYDEGKLPKDENQVMRYYAQAAANGFLPAFYYLGRYIDHPEIYVRRTRSRR